MLRGSIQVCPEAPRTLLRRGIRDGPEWSADPPRVGSTPSGVVVDLVWPNPEECTYFGVPFTAEEMAKDAKAKGLYTVLARAIARGE